MTTSRSESMVRMNILMWLPIHCDELKQLGLNASLASSFWKMKFVRGAEFRGARVLAAASYCRNGLCIIYSV